jgi:hypothetical protein
LFIHHLKTKDEYVENNGKKLQTGLRLPAGADEERMQMPAEKPAGDPFLAG